jgi:hypothetical protein
MLSSKPSQSCRCEVVEAFAHSSCEFQRDSLSKFNSTAFCSNCCRGLLLLLTPFSARLIAVVWGLGELCLKPAYLQRKLVLLSSLASAIMVAGLRAMEK